MIDLKFFILGHQIDMLASSNHLVNSLDMVDIRPKGYLLTIEAGKHQTTERCSVKLFLDLVIDVNDTIGNLKGMLDVKENLHDMVVR